MSLRRIASALLIILSLGLWEQSFAAVAVNDAGAKGTPTTGVSMSMTYTTTAGATMMTAFIVADNSITNPIAMTYNSVSLTEIPSTRIVSAGNFTAIWFCVDNPSVGAALTLAATWSTSRTVNIGAVTFKGTGTCAQIDHPVTMSDITGTVTTLNVGPITSTTDGATVAQGCDSHAMTLGGGGQIAIYNDGTIDAAGSYIIGGTSNTHTWTAAASNVVGTGFHIPATSTNSGPSPGSLSLLGVGK
jgi:hypothetical protein